ncbi:hypothetical protein PanWU01x14_005840, partial [Parasponia andersonii]
MGRVRRASLAWTLPGPNPWAGWALYKGLFMLLPFLGPRGLTFDFSAGPARLFFHMGP